MFEEGIKFEKNSNKFLANKTKEEFGIPYMDSFTKKRVIEARKSIAETTSQKLNITSIALDLLEELGFDRNAEGTIYLADSIENLYHERKAFEEDNEFFDFNNERNNHYSFTNEIYECGLNYLVAAIKEELSKSYIKEESLNDVIYDTTNDIISQIDRCGKKLVYKGKSK